ncbi:hypothetical protein GP486_008093 [Trichoglossum hirsutum]|uniref:Uncharacterized protein n=1 Tax=Trichoglossum hirsutum TaxID=265104 RepID=A0A9P8I567_9PEZI|nr:hypothetical protein GP486_008093 [Trichoglossum hirsutum]
MAMSSAMEPEGKRANRDTQLEVDVMILDYLLYMAAKQVIAGRRAERSSVGNSGGDATGDDSSADMSLIMVDSFLPLFKANHPSYTVPESAQSRLRLLKFSTLIVQRLQRSSSTPPISSLQQLRARNRARAAAWLSHHHSSEEGPSCSIFNNKNGSSGLPVPPQSLRQNRRHVLAHHFPAQTVIGAEEFYGTPASMSLRDTLPAFIELSAYVTSTYRDGRVNETWEKMAAEYMLQAALEAYLVCGEEGEEALRECFAWGFDAQDEENVLVNAMFWDKDAAIMQRWAKIREEHLKALIPPPKTPIREHLESVASCFPLFRFEGRLLDFLWALTRHEAVPVLAQLETGQLDGFSREETESLVNRCGIQIN